MLKRRASYTDEPIPSRRTDYQTVTNTKTESKSKFCECNLCENYGGCEESKGTEPSGSPDRVR